MLMGSFKLGLFCCVIGHPDDILFLHTALSPQLHLENQVYDHVFSNDINHDIDLDHELGLDESNHV